MGTLYLRFKNKFPSSEDEVKDLAPSIVEVRVPRRARKKKQIKYCFVEFKTEEETKQAKAKIASGKFQGEVVYADFLGKGSKKSKGRGVKSTSLNPCRLMVSGLVPGISWKALKEMFPKASYAEIPRGSRKKGSKYGFVEFSNPADARATFDAAQDLNIDGHHITVLYAKVGKDDQENVKERCLKRKVQKEGLTVEEYREREKEKFLKRKASRGEENSPAKKGKMEKNSDDEQNDEESDGDNDENDNDEESDGDEEEDGDDEENEDEDSGDDVQNDEESGDEENDDGNENEESGDDDDGDDNQTDSGEDDQNWTNK